MDLGLRDKIALVTGGSLGIGLRTARLLAAEGCHLGICCRSAKDLSAAAKELQGKGIRLVTVEADVLKPDEAARFVDKCAAELGGIDILINNVGGGVGGTLMNSTDDEWSLTFEYNVFQIVRMIRLVVPHMQRRGGGSIVNLSSISGKIPQLYGNGQYGASKAALIFLTEPLALELVHDNIRVNTVSPGSTIWEEGGAWLRNSLNHPEAFATYVKDGFPMGRLGKPEEVADAIVFLASPRANWINGQNISVDGLEQPIPFQGL